MKKRKGHYEKVNPDDYRFIMGKLKQIDKLVRDVKVRLYDRRVKD